MNHTPESIIETTKQLLAQLGVTYDSVETEMDTTNNVMQISIKGNDLGMLIGYHGKNLDAIKTILSLMINQSTERDNSLRIALNINDYTEKRIDQLKSMIDSAIATMDSKSKDTYILPPMNAADRRHIHTIAEEKGLKTESQGEGRDRHVVLIKSAA